MHGIMPGVNGDYFRQTGAEQIKREKKWLLTQAAFVEMYGRLGGIDLQ